MLIRVTVARTPPENLSAGMSSREHEIRSVQGNAEGFLFDPDCPRHSLVLIEGLSTLWNRQILLSARDEQAEHDQEVCVDHTGIERAKD